jgi:hypothetical protein
MVAHSNSNQKRHKSPEDLMATIGLMVLATLATIGAISRMLNTGNKEALERFDSTTLLYLVAAGVLLLLRQVKTFSFGDVKLEMLERVRERQARQGVLLDDMQLILPLLLPEKECKHLMNLATKRTLSYKGSSPLRNELRRLRELGMIRVKVGYIADLKDSVEFDLAEKIELTPTGIRWAERIGELKAETDSMVSSED